jgi:hypothetical protein
MRFGISTPRHCETSEKNWSSLMVLVCGYLAQARELPGWDGVNIRYFSDGRVSKATCGYTRLYIYCIIGPFFGRLLRIDRRKIEANAKTLILLWS